MKFYNVNFFSFVCNNSIHQAAASADGTKLVPEKRYEVAIKTADVRGAGTSANVFIVLHGAGGDSGERVVDGKFERGATDTVSIVCADLGALSKIRIGHDNKGIAAGWYLDKVIVTDTTTKVQYFFLGGRWLADDEGDKLLAIDIAAQSADGVAVLPTVNYQVSVFTSDLRGAGTDAKVSVELYGTKGNNGARMLDGKFERARIEKFNVGGVDCGSVLYKKK